MNKNESKRLKLFTILFMIITVLACLALLYYYFIGSSHVTTDNAYVGAEMAQITPAVGGIIKAIYYTDTDVVKKDDVLVLIDDIDTKLALKHAKANLAMASAELERTIIDYKRRKNLANTGSVSAEEITDAENSFKAAQAAFDEAKVTVEQAKLDLSRTIIRSPVDGIIAKRQVQLGQRVEIGMPMMSVVPVQELHVNANFKEVQLAKVRIGQPVKMEADIYGSSITYHGKVVGIAGGTGSAFAVIPAQNATGNWIKVVQRLPIRISLDPEQLKQYPLEVGLSMYVDIDISKFDE